METFIFFNIIIKTIYKNNLLSYFLSRRKELIKIS